MTQLVAAAQGVILSSGQSYIFEFTSLSYLRPAQALVDYLGPSGEPVRRPYMNGAAAVRMIADYDDYNGIFGVELWEPGKGFIFDLTHEQEYGLDEQRRESLVPGLITNAEDRFLDQYSDLFPLRHFVRRNTEQIAASKHGHFPNPPKW